MEVCGGQTHSIVKYGLDRVLPAAIELVHGPGCPVCVTSLEMIDRAHAVAARPDVTFCSFGDMLRVPGSHGDLLQLKSQGADVRIVYSPLDAVNIAAANPNRNVVFFAIGFETTAPPNAMALWLARRRKVTNFSALVSHVLVPPAITAILSSPDNRVQGFLGPGHVCTVMGCGEYEPLARRHRVPIVITGFEPIDMLEGVLRTVQQLEAGQADVENQYSRAVRREGNREALKLIEDVFEVCDRKWRGVGLIPGSGYRLRPEYRDHDAERRFEVSALETQESSVCITTLRASCITPELSSMEMKPRLTISGRPSQRPLCLLMAMMGSTMPSSLICRRSLMTRSSTTSVREPESIQTRPTLTRPTFLAPTRRCGTRTSHPWRRIWSNIAMSHGGSLRP